MPARTRKCHQLSAQGEITHRTLIAMGHESVIANALPDPPGGAQYMLMLHVRAKKHQITEPSCAKNEKSMKPSASRGGETFL